MLIDSHSHLNDIAFDNDLENVIENMLNNDVKKALVVGYNKDTILRSEKLSSKYSFLFSSCGIHPHDSKDYDENIEELIIDLIHKNKKFVAIGEIGLDYFKNYSPITIQKVVFKRQLEIAIKEDIPVIIHNRDATEDCFKIIKECFKSNFRGVLHSYSSSYEMAKEFQKLNLIFGISGPVTYKNAHKLRETVKNISLDNLIVETDCPYLTPVPYRGKRNEPAFVELIAKKIAEIKGISLEEVKEITTKNCEKLFNI
jgi:TatD DNase family protein